MKKIRPVIVLQSNANNFHSPVFTVAIIFSSTLTIPDIQIPITGKYPFVDENGTTKNLCGAIFGSGKSHFLKILSYLLKNSIVEGKRAIEYFTGRESDASIRPKIEDPMLIAEMTKAGTIPYLAEFEHQLDNEDRFKEFKEKFEAKAGEPWGKKRQAFAVIQDKADFADCYPFIPY